MKHKALPAVMLMTAGLARAWGPDACGPARLPEGVVEPLGGGGPSHHARGPCITPEIARGVQARIDAYRALHPAPPYAGRGPLLYTFFPQGGNWYMDLAATSFVDLDPSPNFRDFSCTAWSYDTHAGTDSELRSFGEQVIGVPVFSALAGTVIARDDGHPDMNTIPMGQPGNYVIIDHGGGREAWYFHLKNGSVGVSVGQVVRAGEQIGLTASSGHSGGPHLHFESRQSGAVYEPFAGACRPGASGWVHQPAIRRDLYLADAAPSIVHMGTVPGWPFESPRTGQFAITDNDHWLWINVHNLPANSTYRLRYVRPNGQVEFQSSTFPLNNPEFYTRAWYWFWGFYIPDMHSAGGVGTWRIQLDLNGVQALDAPVEVRPQRSADFNRPPAALESLEFDPPAPAAGDAIFCRIGTSLLYDDPDYDIVRYEYRWTVNGQVVRVVTSAGHADAIPANSGAPGAVVSCTVTPSDGRVSGPPSAVSVRIAGGCIADVDDGTGSGVPDGGVTIEDLLYYLFIFDLGLLAADVDDGTGTGTTDGGVTIDDLLYYLARFDAGC